MNELPGLDRRFPGFAEMNQSALLAGPSVASDGIQDLAALLAIAMAMAVLLVGVAGPDPRLVIDGIPMSSALFVAAAALAAGIPCTPGSRAAVALFLAPVALLALTLPVSLDPVAGSEKVLNLLASVLVASILIGASIQRIGTESTLRWIIVLMTLLLAAAVLYKLRQGFFDRQVLFLMNGPIVFARLMGLACVFCLVVLRGWTRFALSVVFFLGALWTASKGPILALVLTIALYTWILGSRRQRLVFLGLIATVGLGVAINFEGLSGWQPLSRIFLVVDAMSSAGGTDWDSIGSRLVLLRESVHVLRDHPLGIGVGSWSQFTGVHWADYPHNFFLELWNEGGLILGTIAVMPYMLFLSRRPDAWWLACVFLLLCQQVSGDLLDSRYWLAFSIVGFLSRQEGVAIPAIKRQAAALHA